MNNVIQVPLSQLRPNPWQPPGRLSVSEDKARKGGESILRSGLIQIPVGRGADGVYEIGDGWQRKSWHEWLVKNGHEEYDHMPVDVRELTDEQMADLIEETDENKANMTVLDRAWLWKKRLADFPKTTQRDFAQRRGISQGELSNTIRLLDLPAPVQDMIISQQITASHGRALLGLRNQQAMISMAGQIVREKLSVAATEDLIKTTLEATKPKLVEEPPVDEEDADNELENETGGEAGTNDISGEPPAITATDHTDEEPEDVTQQAGKIAKEIVQKTFGKDKNKPPVKTPPAAPVKPPAKAPAQTAAPAAVKPVWKRKLVVEERGDNVIVMLAKEGQPPKVRNFPGNIERLFHGPDPQNYHDKLLETFIEETTSAWLKEGK